MPLYKETNQIKSNQWKIEKILTNKNSFDRSENEPNGWREWLVNIASVVNTAEYNSF